jgi:DNA repair protein RadC
MNNPNPLEALIRAVHDGSFTEAKEIASTLTKQLNAQTVTRAHDILAHEHALASSLQEAFVVYALTNRHRILERIVVSTGGMSASIVDIRVVFRKLLLAGAYTFIALHNHPSGEPDPSPEDIRITSELQSAGSIIGIELLDHIIVSLGGSYSWKDHGLL